GRVAGGEARLGAAPVHVLEPDQDRHEQAAQAQEGMDHNQALAELVHCLVPPFSWASTCRICASSWMLRCWASDNSTCASKSCRCNSCSSLMYFFVSTRASTSFVVASVSTLTRCFYCFWSRSRCVSKSASRFL